MTNSEAQTSSVTVENSNNNGPASPEEEAAKSQVQSSKKCLGNIRKGYFQRFQRKF